MENSILTVDLVRTIGVMMESLLSVLREVRLDDKSETARAFKIVTTDMERMSKYFEKHVVSPIAQGEQE